jgi:lipoprotein-releasing system permease protein
MDGGALSRAPEAAQNPPPPFGAWERMLAARYLRAKRKDGGVATIALISFFGILLSVFVLIVTMSVMNGFRETLISRLLGVQGHAFATVLDADPAVRKAYEDKIRAVPGVISVTPIVEGQALAISEGKASGVLVRGMTRDGLESLFSGIERAADGGAPVRVGRLDGFDNPDDPGVAVGAVLARDLRLLPDGGVTLVSPRGVATPMGVAPRSKTYRVQSLFSLDVEDFDRILVFMPIEEAKIFLGVGEPDRETYEIRVEKPDEIDAVRVRIAQALSVSPAAIGTWKDNRRQLVDALNMERFVMRLILMMIVAIAALNIISGLVMLVKNKARDIAILRTMGATRGAVMRIFFMTGATVGVLGAIAGIVLGVLFCIYIAPIQDVLSLVIGHDIFPGQVYKLETLPARLDWSEVWLVGGWAFLMSMLATIPPALNAARLDPVEALRND